MKRVILFLLVMLLLLPAAALADVTISELDPFTGLPLDEAEEETEGEISVPDVETVIWVSAGQYYDLEKRAFAVDLSVVLPAMLYSSVCDGMVTTDTVSITIPSGTNAILYRNGTQIEAPDFSRIEEPGSYVVSISGSSARSIEPLTFTIVPKLTGKLDFVTMPQGFVITSVTKDGTAVNYLPMEADLAEEGEYSIHYICEATGLPYHLDLTIDHTPPELKLEAVQDGVAKGPVDISDIEEDARISITLNGVQIDYSETLKTSGVYSIYLEDAAGNSNHYDFTIMIYLNLSAYIFIFVFVLVIAALVTYLVISRKKLRVR